MPQGTYRRTLTTNTSTSSFLFVLFIHLFIRLFIYSFTHSSIYCMSSSEILKAAAAGPLEGLDLAGNGLGGTFVDAIASVLAAPPPVMPSPLSSSSLSPYAPSAAASLAGSPQPHTDNAALLTAGTSSSSLFSIRSPTTPHSSPLHLPTTLGPTPSLTCKLKHLGLGHNSMSGRAFCSLLDCLHRNTALTSLDLSHNDLQHTAQVGCLSASALPSLFDLIDSRPFIIMFGLTI